ncbi:MAG TPA: hypothetical protein VFP44_18055 [Usitatibacter sp.]|nr:hypothetical protein [Usitatibacter sp.]
MDMRWTTLLASSALALAGSTLADAQTYKYVDNYTFRVARAPEWNLAANEGFCRLRIYVDDRARIQLHGDQIIVATETGKRSTDQGSVCNQPLPFGHVSDFRVTTEHARGAIMAVTPPSRANNFTGGLTIDDPQNGGDIYEVVVAWRNPAPAVVPPVAANDPFPYFDEARACQERVRSEFLNRNRDYDAYLEFAGTATRDDVGPNRERIRGEGWARNRDESRAISYECVLNDRTNRVITSSYELGPRTRVSSLR